METDTITPDAHRSFEYNNSTRIYSDILKDILGSNTASPIPTGAEVESDGSIDLWNSVLISDQSFGDFMPFSQSTSQNFNLEDFDFMQLRPDGPRNISTFEQMVCTAAAQAFKASGWDWGPTHQDSLSAETAKLILPPECANYERSPSDAQAQSPPIFGHNDRNRLLSLILQHCGKEQWIKLAPTFPSEPFLDHMFNRFLESQRIQTLPWFHIPSLPIGAIEDELLAATIATGACLTPHEAVQRFGYVMPDILRYAIIERVRLFFVE